MNKRLLIGFLTCFLLSGFANTATADPCPCPDCPPCHTPTGSPPNCSCAYVGCSPPCEACYACIDCSCQCAAVIDGIYLENDEVDVRCVGDWWHFGLTGSVVTNGNCDCVTWSAPGADPASQNGGCVFFTRWYSPGEKTVTATTPCSSKPRTVIVVELVSLLPDVGEEFDDGDNDPNTKSFVVCVVDPNYEPNVVTVTATPNPSVSEDRLSSIWTLTGGTGTSKLVRTVDRTTLGVTTITCTCCSTTKTTKIYVVKVDKIEINYSGTSWADITGETITVLKSTKYTFKATLYPVITPWPASIFSWSGVASGNEQTIEVTFDSEGNKALTATLCDSTDPNCCKNVTINVVAPTIYQIGFSGDSDLYKTPSAWGGWADGTTLITDPVYIDDTNDANDMNEPVCVTKNSSTVSLSGVKLKIPQTLTYSTTIRVDANGTYNWNESSDVSFSGTTSGAATLGITGNIINQVKKYDNNFQIQWKYKVPSGTNTWYDVNTTSHTVYVTYGTPQPGGSALTVKRINWACEKADGATTEVSVADGIHNGLGDVDPPREPDECDPCELSGNWLLMVGCPYYGECDEQAGLMELAVELLGLGGEVRLVRASTNAGAGNCLDYEYRICPTHGFEKLLLDFYGGGTPANMNQFEGCCETAGSYYAVWPKEKATNDYTMLQSLGGIGVTQHYCRPSGDWWQPCNQPGSTPGIP